MPSDNRVHLVFDLQRILNTGKALLNFYSPHVQNTDERMQELREFEDQGNSLDPELFDFCIWITFLLLRPALLGALHIE